MKPLHYSTKQRIRRLFNEGYTRQELLIMYADYDWKDVLKAVRGLPKPHRP